MKTNLIDEIKKLDKVILITVFALGVLVGVVSTLICILRML